MAQDNPEGYAIIGFFVGLYMFYKGFRQFRNYLLIADTPEIAIRSIPMGFVEFHGKAQGEKTLQSPISHTLCFVYKVVIQRWHKDSDGGGGYWAPHQVDVDGVPFYLADDTGRVLVDSQGAELDVPATASCEAGQGTKPDTGVAATQQELLEYVTRAESHWAGNLLEHGLKAVGPRSDPAKEHGRQALMELFQHTPGSPEFMRGIMTMMAPRMQQHLESMGQQSDPRKEEARQAMLLALQHPPGSAEFMEGVRRAGELTGRPDSTSQFSAISKALGTSPSSATVKFSPAVGRYRFTEYCLVPDGAYDISGTCVENPHPNDANDHNLIVKGSVEKQFLISSKQEKPLESSLRKRALHMILVGAGLAIACMAILLIDLGLL